MGNELNGAWNEYVCDDAYAAKFLHAPCTFGDDAAKLCQFIDDMCQLVHSEGGWLCSSPFAGVNPPAKYTYGTECAGKPCYSVHGWVLVCEGLKDAGPDDPSAGYAGVQHVDFWSANLSNPTPGPAP